MTQTVSLSSDRIDEDTQVFTLNGICDLATALEAEQRISAALEAGRTKIIFDLRGVSSLGMEGLCVLFRGQIRAKARKGRLDLIQPNEHVWALFEGSGMDRAFATFSGLKEAMTTESIAMTTESIAMTTESIAMTTESIAMQAKS
jgi:anti-sigma B factor antagonist